MICSEYGREGFGMWSWVCEVWRGGQIQGMMGESEVYRDEGRQRPW